MKAARLVPLAGLATVVLIVIAFVVGGESSGLWRVLRNAETERRGASSLLLVGAAILPVGSGLFAGITFTLGDFADDLPPQAIQALNALNQDVFAPLVLGVFAFLATGVWILVVSALLLRTSPRPAPLPTS